MAATYNIDVKRGATKTLVMTLTDANGDPLNLTGYSARSKVKANYNSDAVFSLTDTDGISLDPLVGKVTMTYSAARTGLLTAGRRYVWDIELVSGDYVISPLAGYITVAPEVTD